MRDSYAVKWWCHPTCVSLTCGCRCAALCLVRAAPPRECLGVSLVPTLHPAFQCWTLCCFSASNIKKPGGAWGQDYPGVEYYLQACGHTVFIRSCTKPVFDWYLLGAVRQHKRNTNIHKLHVCTLPITPLSGKYGNRPASISE